MDLVLEILRGVRDTADMQHHTYDDNDDIIAGAMKQNSNPDPTPNHRHATQLVTDDAANNDTSINVKFPDGSVHTLPVDSHWRERYLDEYTNEPIDQSLVKEAMVHDMKYFCDKVWEVVSEEEMKQDTQQHPQAAGG